VRLARSGLPDCMGRRFGAYFLAFIKQGEGGFGRLDIVSQVLAIAGIVVWLKLDDAFLALLFMGISALGAVDAVVKTYSRPKSEASLPRLLYAASALLALDYVG
jgi:hypothetical protein